MYSGRVVLRTAAFAMAFAGSVVLGTTPSASASIKPGAYTSDTVTSGVVLLSRPARVEGKDLVLIGRYRIHPTATGGYVDLLPGHRVFLNRDRRGGYSGPAYLNGALIGSIELTPRR